jgi:serine/threonine-protein kinase
MGHVWQARLRGMQGFTRAVALKEVNPSLAVDGSAMDLFIREARAGGRLAHPNVASVLDVGVDHGRLYMAMELVDGLDLRRVMKRAQLMGVPFPPALAGLVVHQVLCALEAAHNLPGQDGSTEPLVHRDISPENILLGRHGDVRVADFGLARTAEAHDQLTLVGVVKGKLNYMAPEQLQAGAVEASWDIYALGNVFHELLTGARPYLATNPLQALDLAYGPVTQPHLLNPNVPRGLSDVASAMRSPDPGARPTATTARSTLQQALGGLLRGVPSSQLAEFLACVTQPTSEPPLAANGPCAKCGGTLRGEWSGGSVVIDRCSDCGGVWLDEAEVNHVVGNRFADGQPQRTLGSEPEASLDAVVGDCPRGHGRLTLHPVSKQSFSVEVCPRCRGVWLDAGELESITHGDVGAALIAACAGDGPP